MKLITFILILTIITPMFVGAGIGMCLIIFALTTKWKGHIMNYKNTSVNFWAKFDPTQADNTFEVVDNGEKFTATLNSYDEIEWQPYRPDNFKIPDELDTLNSLAGRNIKWARKKKSFGWQYSIFLYSYVG